MSKSPVRSHVSVENLEDGSVSSREAENEEEANELAEKVDRLNVQNQTKARGMDQNNDTLQQEVISGLPSRVKELASKWEARKSTEEDLHQMKGDQHYSSSDKSPTRFASYFR